MDPPRLSIVLGRGPKPTKMKKKKEKCIVNAMPYIVVVLVGTGRKIQYQVVLEVVYMNLMRKER